MCSELRPRFCDDHRLDVLLSYGVEVFAEDFSELAIVVLSFFPDFAEEDADSAEVEGGDDDIEGGEVGSLSFVGEVGLQVFF